MYLYSLFSKKKKKGAGLVVLDIFIGHPYAYYCVVGAH